MTLDEIKRFRQLDSKTPGPPRAHARAERRRDDDRPARAGRRATPWAWRVAAKMAEARFNTKEHTIFDHHIVCLAGDGCMQEGVAMEAVEFAGHQKLDNLILIYDSNAVTLDAMAKETQSEDTAKRFEAIGFDVQTVDGHDMEAFHAAFERAKQAGSGKPQLIIAKTLIGKGIPEVAGTQKAHGEGGAKFADERAQGPRPAGRALLRRRPRCARSSPSTRRRSTRRYDAWKKTFDAWKAANPELAEELGTSRAPTRTRCPTDTRQKTPDVAALLRGDPRVPGRYARSRPARPGRTSCSRSPTKVPLLIGGSADLYGSTLNYIGDLKAGDDDFKPGHRTGRNIRFGIREHGMCCDHERHRRARHLPPERRDVPRVRRLLPRRASASRRSATCRSSTSSRTTASASARTARRTSRSRRSPACA